MARTLLVTIPCTVAPSKISNQSKCQPHHRFVPCALHRYSPTKRRIARSPSAGQGDTQWLKVRPYLIFIAPSSSATTTFNKLMAHACLIAVASWLSVEQAKAWQALVFIGFLSSDKIRRRENQMSHRWWVRHRHCHRRCRCRRSSITSAQLRPRPGSSTGIVDNIKCQTQLGQARPERRER